MSLLGEANSGSVEGPAEVKETREVNRELDALTEVVGNMEEELTRLLHVLRPVMGEIEEKPRTETKAVDSVVKTPLGRNLQTVRHRLGELVRAVHFMANKVEL